MDYVPYGNLKLIPWFKLSCFYALLVHLTVTRSYLRKLRSQKLIVRNKLVILVTVNLLFLFL